LLSGVVGWWLRGPTALPQPATPPAGSPPAVPTASTLVPPTILVSSGGLVTLNVEAQPLEWVLDQIVAQGGLVSKEQRSLITAGAAPADAGAAGGCLAAEDPAGLRSAVVLRTLQQGNANDRFQAILNARNDGVVIPEPVLKNLFEADAADAVRLLALEAYLEPRMGDRAALRDTLERALQLPNAAIQREAVRRLDELAEVERIHALSTQTDRR
jgi:hypothetical protein